MSSKLPEIVVEMDSREKSPISFPSTVQWRGKWWKVTTAVKALRFGDYRLKSHPKYAVLERKGSPLELFSCLLGSRKKHFYRQIDRMVEGCRVPVLFIACSAHEVMGFPYDRFFPRIRHPQQVGEAIMQALGRLAAERPALRVWWVPHDVRGRGPRVVGHAALGCLLGCASALIGPEQTPNLPKNGKKRLTGVRSRARVGVQAGSGGDSTAVRPPNAANPAAPACGDGHEETEAIQTPSKVAASPEQASPAG